MLQKSKIVRLPLPGFLHLDRCGVWVIQAAEKALFRNGSETGHDFSRAAKNPIK
jgi:hypothetical protein